MSRMHLRAGVVAGLGVVGVLCAGAGAQTSAATTLPAPPKPTAEQQKVIDAANNWPADQPSPRIDTKVYKQDGTPNENFGKPEQEFMQAHEGFLERAKKPVGVLFLGDSITASWGREGRAIWKERYADLDAANFGINGDRTDYVLWRIDNGELDGIKPKVVVLMIGTNNSRSSAEDVVKGVSAIVARIHAKLPETKVLLLGIFPRGVVATDAQGRPEKRRVKLQTINAELAKLADGEKTRYLEIWKEFLQPDGTISKEVMPDGLHPSAAGYRIWADAMQPVLSEMLK